jgi:ribosome recycling factor
MKKDSEISEDDEKKLLKELQDFTDDWIKKVDEAEKAKEKEIMEV